MATRAPMCRNGAVPLCAGRDKRDCWLPAVPRPSGYQRPYGLSLSTGQESVSIFQWRKLGVQIPRIVAPSPPLSCYVMWTPPYFLWTLI